MAFYITVEIPANPMGQNRAAVIGKYRKITQQRLKKLALALNGNYK
jgi:hypothetical protein